MKWQPIETAPKDGSIMLLYLKRAPSERHYVVPDEVAHYTIGFWEHAAWRSIEVEDCGGMGGELTGWMPDWVCIDVEPTHWMPLPEPPHDAKPEEEK